MRIAHTPALLWFFARAILDGDYSKVRQSVRTAMEHHARSGNPQHMMLLVCAIPITMGMRMLCEDILHQPLLSMAMQGFTMDVSLLIIMTYAVYKIYGQYIIDYVFATSARVKYTWLALHMLLPIIGATTVMTLGKGHHGIYAIFFIVSSVGLNALLLLWWCQEPLHQAYTVWFHESSYHEQLSLTREVGQPKPVGQ